MIKMPPFFLSGALPHAMQYIFKIDRFESSLFPAWCAPRVMLRSYTRLYDLRGCGY